jgi:cold shock CspA family protein
MAGNTTTTSPTQSPYDFINNPAAVLSIIMSSDFQILRAHLRRLEPAPKRNKETTPMTDYVTGTVVFYSGIYGVAIPDGIDADDRANHYFIHAAALKRSGLTNLAQGQRIRFRIEPPKREGMKREAQEIRVLG